MKKLLPMMFVLILSAALLIGCTASAQSAASAETSAQPEQLTDGMPTDPEVTLLSGETTVRETVTPSDVSASQKETAAFSDLCTVCDDNACDGGKHGAEAGEGTGSRTDKTPCSACGDYDCNDGVFCDATYVRRTESYHHADQHGSHHG